MFGPQKVCELDHLLQNCLLTFLLPCLALRMYVNWTICCKGFKVSSEPLSSMRRLALKHNLPEEDLCFRPGVSSATCQVYITLGDSVGVILTAVRPAVKDSCRSCLSLFPSQPAPRFMA